MDELGKGRVRFLYFCLVLAFCLVAFRLIIVVVNGDKVFVKKFYDSSKNRKRGNIIDRNGVIVATDLKAKSGKNDLKRSLTE